MDRTRCNKKSEVKKRILFVLYIFLAFVIGFIGIDRYFSLKDKKGRIVIGSKSAVESQMLAEMMALLIEKYTDLKVVKKYNLEGSFVTFHAIRSSDIDIFPEYTGTALVAILKKEPIADPKKSYEVVKDIFLEKFDIVWLKPFGFENSYALVMQEKKAKKLGIKNISDAAKHKYLRYGFNAEFAAREEFKLMEGRYEFDFKVTPKIMDHALLYFSLANDSIDIMNGFTTDAEIIYRNLRVLEDDKKVFPAYVAAPLVRAQILKKYPKLQMIIEKLANQISTEEMQRMNYEVDYEGKNSLQVAKDFLVRKGFL